MKARNKTRHFPAQPGQMWQLDQPFLDCCTYWGPETEREFTPFEYSDLPIESKPLTRIHTKLIPRYSLVIIVEVIPSNNMSFSRPLFHVRILTDSAIAWVLDFDAREWGVTFHPLQSPKDITNDTL